MRLGSMVRLKPNRVLMLVENQSFPQDVRGVYVFRYPNPPVINSILGYIWEYGYSLIAAWIISFIVLINPGFDIIHAGNPPDTAVFIAAFYKLLRKRFIFDHHDLAPELYLARFGNKGIQCRLVGAGDAYDMLRKLADEIHLKDHLLFTGWVTQSEVARCILAGDICVAPEPSNPFNDRSTMIKNVEIFVSMLLSGIKLAKVFTPGGEKHPCRERLIHNRNLSPLNPFLKRSTIS